MTEKRSVPAALAIVIGPGIAYLSYFIYASGYSEYLQIFCFGLFLLTGFELARSGISLSGSLALLLIPSLPLAIYLRQAPLIDGNQLGPGIIVGLWAVNILAGAIFAGGRRVATGDGGSIKRLIFIAIGLLLLIFASFIV